jgi:4-amino-4-deoxy-L-arabinose transferase-like glycosyltransferase
METLAKSRPFEQDTESLPFLPTRRQLCFLVAIYLGFQFVARSFVSEAAGIDEAYQVIVGQRLTWGYGPHAPLYTWLMMLFLKVFGSSTTSLNLLREVLLFGIYALTYANARVMTRSHACGVVAAAALQFHPTIVWESQRELTNSLAASLTILAALLSFLMARNDRWGAWISFGICSGLMALSKYNAALFYAALLLAAASTPSLRARFFNFRLAVAVSISALVVTPNLWWVATHKDLAFQLVWKFGIHESMTWGHAVVLGLKNWFESWAAHIAPVIVVFAVIFWRAIFVDRDASFKSDEAKLLFRALAFVTLMTILSIFFIKVTEFKDRWLQPIYISLPILLVAVLQRALTSGRLKIILGFSTMVTLAVGFAASGRLYFSEARGRRDVLTAPFARLSDDLGGAVHKSDFILAGNYWLAGNLRLRFPQKKAYCPDLLAPQTAVGHTCLVVWEVGRKNATPPELLAFAREFTGSPVLPPPQYAEELWKYHRKEKLRLAFWMLQKESVSN